MLNEYPEREGLGRNLRKQQYVPPMLIRYGQVRDLTQTGTGQVVETRYGNNQCLGQDFWIWPGGPNRKNCHSDLRVKESIIRIGTHPLGFGLYLFDYKPAFRDECGHGRQFGVMAQEVEVVMPEAVCVHPDGYMAVDYEMLGISCPSH
jgi:hypothetical protein